MCHFRNDRTFDCNKKFRSKSTFNPKNKDAIMETYLSSLEEKLLDIYILTSLRGERCLVFFEK